MGRLFYLDNLRSFALILGIFFHAAIVYAPHIHYAIQNPDRLEFFAYFCFWVHSFRMPLFFIISGFFSALVWEKKGSLSYLKGRIQRIMIPALFGLLFFAPVQYYLMLKIKQENLGFVSFLHYFFTFEDFAQSHIWFLVDLVLFSMMFFFFPKQWLKRGMDFFPSSLSLQIFYFCLFSFSMVLIGHSFFPSGDEVLGIGKLTLVYQSSFFWIGIASYHTKNTIFQIRNVSNISLLVLFFVCMFSFVLFYEIEIIDELWMPFYYGRHWIRALHLFLWCLSPLVWTLFFVFLFQKWFHFENRFTKYLIDSSLPIYLIHHPLSLFYAYCIRTEVMGVTEKFFLHVGFVLSLSFLAYDVWIQNSKLLSWCFGVRKNS
ncbi:acyltransferase family protein [Leptospira ryugenii]|uniref:acyltransferase family protein n=1 Tax=Leptospira ryugenii TaxID=1917863 RepID=UPI000D59516A|nr:acyltransferase family protein [Leptospira ryugenii]